MIGYLKGRVIYRRDDGILLEVGGVGYRVCISQQSATKFEVGTEAEVFCYHFVREDANELFGFDSPAQLDIFEKLIQVSGVGPKLGLAIVSSLGRERIFSAINQNNPTAFKAVSGVGGKLAAKIVIELKSKLSGGETIMPEDDETAEALVALGYKKSEILPYLTEIPADLVSTNDKIRFVLKHISKK